MWRCAGGWAWIPPGARRRMRDVPALMPGTLPGGGHRNGMPGYRDYSVYRGKLPLEVELPYVCADGCGRRMESDRWPVCAVCRGTWPGPVTGQGFRSDLKR